MSEKCDKCNDAGIVFYERASGGLPGYYSCDCKASNSRIEVNINGDVYYVNKDEWEAIRKFRSR
jgi:hypothetical protein